MCEFTHLHPSESQNRDKIAGVHEPGFTNYFHLQNPSTLVQSCEMAIWPILIFNDETVSSCWIYLRIFTINNGSRI
jgi:hypothetical protein